MKVLVYSPTLQPTYGGGERQIAYFTNVARSRGYEVDLLTKLGSVPSCDLAYVVPKVVGSLQEQVTALERLSTTGIPYVIRVTSSGRAQGFCRASSAAREAFLNAKGFVALNDDTALELKELGINSRHVLQLRNGTDTSRFVPATSRRRQWARAIFGLDPHTLVVLCVARFVAKKRLPLLCDAWCRTFSIENDAEAPVLIIVGGANGDFEEENIEKRLVEIVAERQDVRLLGRLDPEAMVIAYWASNLLVTASSSEGMSNAVVEAMSCGLPVVAPKVNCYDFVFEPEPIGFPFDLRIGGSLGDSLRLAVNSSSEKLKRFGEMARKRAEQDLALPATIDPFLEFLLGMTRSLTLPARIFSGISLSKEGESED